MAKYWGPLTAETGLLGRAGAGHPSKSREGRGGRRYGQVPCSHPAFCPLQCDRLAADCAQELRRHGVSYVSLWPGMVQTELVKEVVVKNENTDDPLLKQVGKRRVREVENAEDSASPSSMTRQ